LKVLVIAVLLSSIATAAETPRFDECLQEMVNLHLRLTGEVPKVPADVIPLLNFCEDMEIEEPKKQ